MELLYNWISEIIVFLLIATIIDLLIPENSYKKYVKLVVGLVLLLIFLKPLFYLFNLDLDQEISKIATSFEEVDSDRNKNLQKKEIQRGQDAYIYEHMENELKAIAQYSLIDEYQVEIESIDFLFEEDFTSYEGLRELVVYVAEYKGEGRIIKPIKDIRISGGEKNDDSRELTDELIHLLKDLWELDQEQITIVWVGS